MRLLDEYRRSWCSALFLSHGPRPGAGAASGVRFVGDVPDDGKFSAPSTCTRSEQRSAAGDEELLSVSHLTGVTRVRRRTVTMFMARSRRSQAVPAWRPRDQHDVGVDGRAWCERRAGIVSPPMGLSAPYRCAIFCRRMRTCSCAHARRWTSSRAARRASALHGYACILIGSSTLRCVPRPGSAAASSTRSPAHGDTRRDDRRDEANDHAAPREPRTTDRGCGHRES